MNERPDLLAGLPQEDANQILALGDRIILASGSELFSLGEQADRLFLVQRGRIKLTLPMQIRGKEENVLVEEINHGQTVGWSALIPPHRFTLKATALLDSELIALSRDTLCTYFAEHPLAESTVRLNLAVIVGHRLQLFQAMWLREMQRIVELQYA
jgi:CRP-like cAMP-binding protein